MAASLEHRAREKRRKIRHTLSSLSLLRVARGSSLLSRLASSTGVPLRLPMVRALTALVAASLVGTAQAKYSCTSDSQCAYVGCRAGDPGIGGVPECDDEGYCYDPGDGSQGYGGIGMYCPDPRQGPAPPCPAGTYSGDGLNGVGERACRSCGAGKYASSAESTACTSCDAGTYITWTGASTCTSCAAGKYSTTVGATSASTCINCGAGKYKAFAGGAEIENGSRVILTDQYEQFGDAASGPLRIGNVGTVIDVRSGGGGSSSSSSSSSSVVVDKNTQHFVILEVRMPYSKAEFDADKQTKYKKAMARVALTIPENIVIGITEARRRANNTTFSLLAVKHVSTGVNTDDVNQERSFEAHISNIAKKAPRGESTPANDHLRSTCAVYTDSSCPSGDRVKRGPDWEWGNQDGGDGLGTVQSRDGAGWCEVEWDNGGSNSYRVGKDGAHDLCSASASASKLMTKIVVMTKILAQDTKRLEEIRKDLGTETKSLLAKINVELKAEGLQEATGVSGTTETESSGDDSCKYAKDRDCDEPCRCKKGTDTTDCRSKSSSCSSSSSSSSSLSGASRPLTDASLIVLCGAVTEICKTAHTDLAAGRFTRPLFAVMLFSYFQLGSPSAEELEVHRGVGNRLGELKSSKGAERQWDLHQRRGETR